MLWQSLAADLTPQSRQVGHFDEVTHWGNFHVPGATDTVFLHNGVWRPQLSGSIDYPPPTTVLFGDYETIYQGIGGGRVTYQGRDRTVEDIWVVRGDFEFALGGETLYTDYLKVREYSADSELPPGHEVTQATTPFRGLTLSGGTVSVGENVQVLADSLNSSSAFPSVLRVQSGAHLAITDDQSSLATETALFVSGFTEGERQDSRLEVRGEGSLVTIASGRVIIAGTAEISDGGRISAADSVWDIHDYGALIVDDAQLVTHGVDGRIRVFQEAEARFSNNALVSLVDQFRCDGVCTIESGARFETSGRFSGSGTSGLIGRDTPGEVTVTGSGSQWSQDGVLAVGWNTTGDLSILDGGTVQSRVGVVGRNAGSSGDVLVRTTQGLTTSWRIEESLALGTALPSAAGVGSLTISGVGSLVDVGTEVSVGDGATVSVERGGALRVGYSESTEASDGAAQVAVNGGHTLSVSPGGLVSVGNGDANSSAELTSGVVVGPNGILSGSGQILAESVWNSGVVSPGNSPGQLDISGDYFQAEAGRLVFEIESLDQGGFDVLNVAGDATITGTIELRFLEGFELVDDSTITVIQSAGFLDVSAATFVARGLRGERLVEFVANPGSLVVQFASAPEPSSLGLLGVVAAAILNRRRKSPWLP